MGLTAHRYPSLDKLCRVLAADILSQLAAGIRLRGRATLVLSGGSTPAPLYEYLSQQAFAWEKVTITLTDERWVPSHDARSNQAMLVKTLLVNQASAATFLSFVDGAKDAQDAAYRVSQTLSQDDAPFDYVLLGMGLDGHTASLFPDAPELAEALAPEAGVHCCVLQPESSEVPRLSLTLPRLLRAERLGLLIRGDDKWVCYEQAYCGARVESMPVSAFFQQTQVPMGVYWCG